MTLSTGYSHVGFFALPLILIVSGCASMHESVDFERHSMSSLSESRTKTDVLIFQAQTDGLYPAEDPAAERRRMEWLEGWLKARDFCPNGYEITERRGFHRHESNPRNSDLRYELHCTQQ